MTLGQRCDEIIRLIDEVLAATGGAAPLGVEPGRLRAAPVRRASGPTGAPMAPRRR